MVNNRVTGPVPVPPGTRAAMQQDMISHRSQDFGDIFDDVVGRLRPVFGTEAAVLPLTCSGTGGMEAAVASVLRPGDRVLSVQLGYFGQRFAEIARFHGADVTVLASPWGEVPDPAEVADRAAGCDAVLLTHNETSTGVLGPLRQWVSAIRSAADPLLLVDVVSSLGATELAFDELGLDVAVGVTQKALACPPGLSLVAASERALERARRPGRRSYYLDLAGAADQAEGSSTSYTPAVPVFYALRAALAEIERTGLAQVWQRHERTARRCRDAVRCAGLTVIPDESICSPTVTAIRLPGDAGRVREALRTRYGTLVSSGRSDWKEQVLRIGHMGPVTDQEIDDCVAAVATALADGRVATAEVAAARDVGGTLSGGLSTRTRLCADELGEEWDALTEVFDGPVFHRLSFLRAYEHHPVARISDQRYVEIRSDAGLLVAAASMYRQADPLGLLGLAEGENGLLSSMWHCPDTRVLARDDASLDALHRAFAAEARQLGCSLWGFINLDAENPAVEALQRRGFTRRDLVARWTLSRKTAPDATTYLAHLARPARHELRRQLRRGNEQGAHNVVHGADHEGLVELLQLVAATATRAGSPKYYDPPRLAALLREIGDPVRIIEIRDRDGGTLAAGICFVDERRIQFWAAGFVRDREDLAFSPYYYLWWQVLEMMWSTNVVTAECGRLNEKFKRKMGLSPRPLVAMIGGS